MKHELDEAGVAWGVSMGVFVGGSLAAIFCAVLGLVVWGWAHDAVRTELEADGWEYPREYGLMRQCVGPGYIYADSSGGAGLVFVPDTCEVRTTWTAARRQHAEDGR